MLILPKHTRIFAKDGYGGYPMKEMKYADVISETLDEEMARDDNVVP